MINYNHQKNFFSQVQKNAIQTNFKAPLLFTVSALVTIAQPFNFILSPFSTVIHLAILAAKYLCFIQILNKLGLFTGLFATVSLLLLTGSSVSFIFEPFSLILTGLLVATLIVSLAECINFGMSANDLIGKDGFNKDTLINSDNYLALTNLNFLYLATTCGVSAIFQRLEQTLSQLFSKQVIDLSFGLSKGIYHYFFPKANNEEPNNPAPAKEQSPLCDYFLAKAIHYFKN